MARLEETTSLYQAMWRGFRCRCPNCGKGRLFGKYLKVADHCEECGEEFHHHRADDFPAYLVIIVVGHVIVPAVLAVETAYSPPYWLHFLIWLPLTLVSSLGLLQPTKGAIVGLQWQTGMHGFEAAKKRRLKQLAITASAAPARASFGPRCIARYNRTTQVRSECSAMDYSSKFNSLLYDLKRDGRYRTFIDLERQVGALPTAIWRQPDGTGQLVTVWCSNDYLGMGQHPDARRHAAGYRRDGWRNGRHPQYLRASPRACPAGERTRRAARQGSGAGFHLGLDIEFSQP